MRVIMTGGGTGGHIYPAIAIADTIKAHDPDAEILYLGSAGGLEADIVPKAGYPIRFVTSMWVDRSNVLRIAKTVSMNLKGIREARAIMKEFKPDVVIGTGGYVCFPVIYAGHRFGAKCYIHEQNAFPGVANKSLERFVNKVFLGFGEASQYFHEPKKHVVVGNPVRASFASADRGKARERLGIDAEDFVIFSFGGSQGAERINEVVFELMKQINGEKGVTLLFGTGSRYYQDVIDMAVMTGHEPKENVRIESYIDDMPDYLAAADIIISRSGALSVAETCVVGRGSVMIPSPNVTGNHQYFNAKSVADKGGAVLIEEKDLTADRLLQEVLALKNDPERVREMGKIASGCVPHDAAERICDTVMKDL